MVFFNQRQEISGRKSGQVRRGIAEIGGTFLFAAKGGLWRPALFIWQKRFLVGKSRMCADNGDASGWTAIVPIARKTLSRGISLI